MGISTFVLALNQLIEHPLCCRRLSVSKRAHLQECLQAVSSQGDAIAFLRQHFALIMSLPWQRTDILSELCGSFFFFFLLIYDAAREQDCLPKTAPRGPKNLLEMLPEEFSLKDYANLRREQGFDDNRKRTMDAVYQWVSRGYVVKLLKDDSADTDADSLIFRKVQYRRSYLLKRG